jgi:NhaA family Na+:H+ antiporter
VLNVKVVRHYLQLGCVEVVQFPLEIYARVVACACSGASTAPAPPIGGSAVPAWAGDERLALGATSVAKAIVWLQPSLCLKRMTFAIDTPNPSFIRRFIRSEASGGLVLMGAAMLALIIANSPLAPTYFGVLASYVGGLSILHWINDALMAVFFLMVGLEIKREVLTGHLSTWPQRILPGIAALGGMIVPAAIYLFLNWGSPETTKGWAIPAATDIAFSLGILALLGSRVPLSLKVFLTAVAIIDDLGAIAVIALFYTAKINVAALAGAALMVAVLIILNRTGVNRLPAYLVPGAVLWYLVLLSGVHATIAGVLLALTIPLQVTKRTGDSPLLRLEHAIHPGSRS